VCDLLNFVNVSHKIIGESNNFLVLPLNNKLSYFLNHLRLCTMGVLMERNQTFLLSISTSAYIGEVPS
jgi:hypothetical protein